MGYNADNAIKVETQSKIEKDKIYDCIVCKIEDGIVKDLLPQQHHAAWKGSIDQPCINLSYQIKWGETDKDFIEFSQLFTYNVDEEGKTVYNEKSKMGKYAKKYGNAPKVGDMIKVITNGEAKPSIMLA